MSERQSERKMGEGGCCFAHIECAVGVQFSAGCVLLARP